MRHGQACGNLISSCHNRHPTPKHDATPLKFWQNQLEVVRLRGMWALMLISLPGLKHQLSTFLSEQCLSFCSSLSLVICSSYIGPSVVDNRM